jgi:hypothetical protein
VSKKRSQGLETAHTTVSGFPNGAKVFEVMNWHDGESRPTPEQLALFREHARKWNNW